VQCIGQEEWRKVVSGERLLDRRNESIWRKTEIWDSIPKKQLQPSESVSYLPNLLGLLSPSRREVVG
jgi:hypothetical protein